MKLRRLVELALEEDVGPGDITTTACVDPAKAGRGGCMAPATQEVQSMASCRCWRAYSTSKGS